MESLRADSVFSRGYPETTCARGGALQGRCERVFRAGRAGCRPALALQPPGTCDRADPREPVSARDRGQCRLEIDPPGRRGGSRRRAVVSDAAGIQRVPGVGTESLRADSAFSRRVSRTTCARGGALQGRCERVFRAGTGRMPACAGAAAAGCVQPSRSGVRICAGPRAVRRLELTHSGAAGKPSQVPWSVKLPAFSGAASQNGEPEADSVFSRGYPETTCARGGALQGRCERVFRAGTGRMPACAGAAAAGYVRPSRSGVRVCAGAPAVRRLEIDPPRRRGDNRRRAVSQ